MKPLVVVENLVKTYRIAMRQPGLWGAFRGVASRQHRTITALDGISFELEKGELVGYIGPNGAGKSTTVKLLSGIVVPDSGRCEIAGRVPWRDRIDHVAGLGVVFGQRTQLWWDLPVRQLSLGQRMRCDLVAALLHNPALLFLDEPTIGLDAVSKLAVRDFIKRINRERETTVILTTHDMDDIEALCSRVMVINKGRILSDGTVDELRSRVSSERRLIVDLEQDGEEEISDPEARVIRREGHRWHLGFDLQRTPTATLIARITSHHAVKDLFVENPPIEEIVAQLYEQEGM